MCAHIQDLVFPVMTIQLVFWVVTLCGNMVQYEHFQRTMLLPSSGWRQRQPPITHLRVRTHTHSQTGN